MLAKGILIELEPIAFSCRKGKIEHRNNIGNSQFSSRMTGEGTIQEKEILN